MDSVIPMPKEFFTREALEKFKAAYLNDPWKNMKHEDIFRTSFEEAIGLYEKWNYPFKPSMVLFLTILMQIETKQIKITDELEQQRGMAYYSQHEPTAHNAFERLACLIYIATIKKIATPYDHVIYRNKDFEWKLNHLHIK